MLRPFAQRTRQDHRFSEINPGYSERDGKSTELLSVGKLTYLVVRENDRRETVFYALVRVVKDDNAFSDIPSSPVPQVVTR